MKKFIYSMIFCIIFWISSLQVCADAIFEPRDSFYEKYRYDCQYLNRTYIACGQDGEVKVYKTPEAKKVVTSWQNGKSVYISFSYTAKDGTLWGVYDNGDKTQSGWVRLDDMMVKYDYLSFEEEFGAEIVEESGVFEPGEEWTELYFWKYPGAKTYRKWDFNYADSREVDYSKSFVDEEGHKWGYVGYFYGMKRCWICLDMPVAEYEELYPDGGPKREDEQLIALQENYVEATPSSEDTVSESPEADIQEQLPFVAGIVAAVVAVTGVLLAFLKKNFGTGAAQEKQ